MRRVLLCNEAVSAGGIGRHTLTLLRGLAARGWRASLLVTSGRGELHEEAAGVAARCVDLSGAPLSLRKLARARDAVLDEAPDVLLLNHCPLAHHALPFLGRAVRPVAVLHSGAAPFYRVAALHAARIFRWVAPTEALRDQFVARLGRGERDRVRIVAHGVDTAVFCAAGRGERPPHRFAVAFVGHLGENKGADLLPEICARVAAAVPHAGFTICGHGSMHEALAAEFRARGVSATFRPHLPPESPAARRRACAGRRHPTRVEGFGLVLAEAQLCGAVPVATRLPGVTDRVVEDRRTGVLVERDDVPGFVAALRGLAADAGRLAALAEAATGRAAVLFPASRMLDDYEALFAEADDRRPAPARGRAGWLLETAREGVRGRLGRGWLARRLREIVA